VLVEQITSRQNPLIKRAQQIRVGNVPGFLFAEGARLVDEALSSLIGIEAIVYTAEFANSDRGRLLLGRVAHSQVRGALVPEPVFRSVCDTESPQGILALAVAPKWEPEDLFRKPLPFVLALDGLQDPGNVGTIVRAAEAAGAAGIMTTPGTAEPFSPKALRASMGSAFRLPIVRRLAIGEGAKAARAAGCSILAAIAAGERAYHESDWRRPVLAIIGNEGAGLSPGTLALADETVSIPIEPTVESLNAAVAATVLLFEAARQRRAS